VWCQQSLSMLPDGSAGQIATSASAKAVGEPYARAYYARAQGGKVDYTRDKHIFYAISDTQEIQMVQCAIGRTSEKQ
jgi:hypothetical protein